MHVPKHTWLVHVPKHTWLVHVAKHTWLMHMRERSDSRLGELDQRQTKGVEEGKRGERNGAVDLHAVILRVSMCVLKAC